MRLPVFLVVGALAGTVFVPLLQAQSGIPGGPIRASVSSDKYRAYVMANADTLISEWREAWRVDDVGEVVDRYADDALLVLPDGRPLIGRDEIERRLEALLRQTGDIELGQLDFSASTRIGFRSGSFRIDMAQEAPIRGRHVTLVMRGNDGWRIRSQFFFPEPDGPGLAPDPSVGAPLSPERVAGAMARRESWESYRADVFAQVNRTTADLARAWREGDPSETAGLYAEEGTLRLPWSERFRGRAAIEAGLAELLPRIGALHMAVLDFDTSGGLAYVHGRYYLEFQDEKGREEVVGPYVLIFRLKKATVVRAHFLERAAGS